MDFRQKIFPDIYRQKQKNGTSIFRMNIDKFWFLCYTAEENRGFPILEKFLQFRFSSFTKQHRRRFKERTVIAMNRKKAGKILFILLGATAIIALTAFLLPAVLSLKDEDSRAAFAVQIQSLGAWGPVVLLLIQIIQIIVAIIPGEPIEILAGVMYGTWGGLALCLTGVLIATVIIYFTVRKLGRNAVNKMIKKEESAKYAFLFSEKNIVYLIFLLFFIPGVPKDVLVYLCPFTKIKPLQFFLISTFARIPSVITSTWAGENLSEGKFWESVLIFAVTGAVALLGILIHNRFIAKKEKHEGN